MLSRRGFLGGGAAFTAVLVNGGRPAGSSARPAAVATILMLSTPNGSDVWFDPVGLWVPAGTIIRWSNGADQSNTHTSTAYHPANGGRALRIPPGARPWDSGYLLPGHSFEVRLSVEGIYDYFCRPHEGAGMAGRIVAGRAGEDALAAYERAAAAHPDWLPPSTEARKSLPPLADILKLKSVHPAR